MPSQLNDPDGWMVASTADMETCCVIDHASMAKKRETVAASSSLTEQLEITLRWPKVYNDDIVYFVQILSVEWQPFGDVSNDDCTYRKGGHHLEADECHMICPHWRLGFANQATSMPRQHCFLMFLTSACRSLLG